MDVGTQIKQVQKRRMQMFYQDRGDEEAVRRVKEMPMETMFAQFKEEIK